MIHRPQYSAPLVIHRDARHHPASMVEGGNRDVCRLWIEKALRFRYFPNEQVELHLVRRRLLGGTAFIGRQRDRVLFAF